MDAETIYSVAGIALFALIAYKTLKNTDAQELNDKENKRNQIVREYKNELHKALAPLKDDNKAMLAKKSELLKKFSDELSRNIFFDAVEIREVILDLAEDY